MKRSWPAAALMVVFFSIAEAGADESALQLDPFGKVALYQTSARPNNVVIFISGDGGWNLGVVDMARALSRLDALVAGIDINSYLWALARTSARCAYPAADFENLSKFLQKSRGFAQYRPPVLVGYSSGATLAYAILAQAPPNTFKGAVSLGFCPDLVLAKPLCRGSGLQWQEPVKGHTYIFLPADHLPVPWIAFQGTIDQVCIAADAEGFVQNIKNGRLVRLPGVGHGFSVQSNWMPQFKQAFATLTAAGTEPTASTPATLNDLPLVEVPATGKATDWLAVFLSGDGGWAGLDQAVSSGLAEQGIPVAGLNTLNYFWTPRTPERTAGDLERILRHYLAQWKRDRILLIGYSFGADVLPSAINRLPGDLKSRIALAALLGPGKRVSFEFHLSDWLGGSENNGYPTLPEVERMAGMPTLCIYGEEEADSICPQLEQKAATVLALKGAHHFGGNYDPIVKKIIDALEKPNP